MSDGLWRGKVLMILGGTDGIIVRREIEKDAIECFGHSNLETVIIDAGHDVPISEARQVAKSILRFWGEGSEVIEAVPEIKTETST